MILITLPHCGFDPTEASVPWKILTDHKIKVVFATPDGKVASADNRILTGKGFGIFKKMLMADESSRSDYQSMNTSIEFNHPITYSQIDINDYDGIILPGGHDKGMKTYLESTILRTKIADAFNQNKLIGAICHGTIAVARTINENNGTSFFIII